MTTYIINGNAASPHAALEGIPGTGTSEQFIIMTNDRCPEANLKFIEQLCASNSLVQHRKIKASAKKWFAAHIKSCYAGYLTDLTDRVVVMPTVTISGVAIEKDISAGRVCIASDYLDHKKNAASLVPMSDWDRIPSGDIRAGGRMHILIDYENVSNPGLEGAQYLTKNDYVTVFYSSSSENIQQGYFQALTENSGSFDLVKLKQIRKNGLDFYIAIRVGEILQKYPGEKILIVSQDQGYYAILDYCSCYADIDERIRFATSIETGIVLLDGETSRRQTIMDARKSMNLETGYEKYQEKKALYERISAAIAGTPYADEIDRIFGLVRSKETPKALYTASLHTFGVKRGQEVYRLIKRGA